MNALTKIPGGRVALDALDVTATLEDDRHMGWGLAVADDLPMAVQARLFRHIAVCASASGWDYEALFLFTNSKPARHLADEFHGPHMTADAALDIVRKYVNNDTLAMLRADERRG